MATIYRKTNLDTNQPSGYDNTLILGQHESILYPFDLGDYNEIRVGALWTFTTWNSDNAAVANAVATLESTYTLSHKRQSLYVGLNNSSLSLPYENGNSFIGIGILTGVSSVNVLGVTNPYGPPSTWGITCAGAAEANPVASTIGTVHLLLTHNNYGISGGTLVNNPPNSNKKGFTFNTAASVGVAQDMAWLTGINSGNSLLRYGFFSMQATFTQNNENKRIYSFRLITNDPYPASTSALDCRVVTSSSNRTIKFLNSYPTLLEYGPLKTGYWTEDFTSGTPNLPKPTAFFLFNPFSDYRLRIHNIIAEKYA